MSKKKKDICFHKRTAKAYVRVNDYKEVEYCMDCFTEIRKNRKKLTRG